MSDHDRGAYTPQTDAPLAFDARSPRARRPLPFALIASGAVLLVLVGSVALYYRSGSSAVEGAPAGGQQVAAVKTAPPAGDPKDAADYLEVYAAQNVPSNAQPSQPAFAPPPEQPQPRPAPGLKVVPVDTAPIHAATPMAPPATVPKPIAVASADIKPALPAAPAAPAAPALKPAVPAPKPVTVATAPVAPVPAPPPAPAATPAPAASSGGALVQIGAFSSNALADKGWKDIAAAFPSQMAGKAKRVEPLAKDGSTLYRTSVTGFSDKASAQAFCQQLKAAGRACFVKG